MMRIPITGTRMQRKRFLFFAPYELLSQTAMKSLDNTLKP